MSGITEEYRCGYCLSSFEWMTDPRTLNCGHSFCLTCLKGDLQMYERIECPACKVTVTDVDVESLPALQLDEENSAATRESEHVPCDSCVTAGKEESKAEFFCETCNVKFCVEHDKMHEKVFGKKHPILSITKYLETPGKFKVEYCETHEYNELSLACERCMKILCIDCDISTDVCESIGGPPHTLKSFSVMKERLQKEYEEALRNLIKKSQAICKLEKLAWRRLDKVTEHAEDMLKEVDKATEEQIAAIRENAELLKVEIRQYITKCNEQTEVYIEQILTDLRKVDNLRTELHSAVRRLSPPQLIKDGHGRTERITKVMKMEPKKILLDKKVLYKKGESRNTDVAIRSSIPSEVHYQRSRDASGNQPNSTSHLSTEKVAVGRPTLLQIVNPIMGGIEASVNTPGLAKVSSFNQKAYALVNADGKQMVKSYTADLQTCTDILAVESITFSDLTVTKEFIILVDNEKKLLSVYDFNGEQKVEISLVELNNDVVSSICSLDDDYVLVTAGSRMYCYALEGDNSPVWTSELAGLRCACCEPSTGYIWAVAGQMLHLYSPDGQPIKHFQALDLNMIFGYQQKRHLRSWIVSGMSSYNNCICIVGNLTVCYLYSQQRRLVEGTNRKHIISYQVIV